MNVETAPIIKIPAYVAAILRRLSAAGFASYAVGGCVRDRLIGRRVHDWDICTAALPEDTERLFKHTALTGKRYGTVTVSLGKMRIEVTTMRADGGYADHRRPNGVTFVSDIAKDLSRRDFTVNAMAADELGRVTDILGGMEDLRCGVLRCVGDAGERFSQDALRMLRAVRFSAVLGFEIDETVLRAIDECAPMAALLSRERVCAETEKILMSDRPQLISRAADMGLLAACGVRQCADASGIKKLPKNRSMRWSAFLALCRADSSGFRLDAKTVELCALSPPLPEKDWEIRALAAQKGADRVLCIAAKDEVSGCRGQVRRAKKALSEGVITRAELNIGGKELAEMGITGKQTGQMIAQLLLHTARYPQDNQPEKLKQLVKKKIGGWYGKI